MKFIRAIAILLTTIWLSACQVNHVRQIPINHFDSDDENALFARSLANYDTKVLKQHFQESVHDQVDQMVVYQPTSGNYRFNYNYTFQEPKFSWYFSKPKLRDELTVLIDNIAVSYQQNSALFDEIEQFAMEFTQLVGDGEIEPVLANTLPGLHTQMPSIMDQIGRFDSAVFVDRQFNNYHVTHEGWAALNVRITVDIDTIGRSYVDVGALHLPDGWKLFKFYLTTIEES